MFSKFESLVHPYPDALPPPPPKTFFAFLWECSRGVRPWLLLVTLFTAGIGAFEALLFSMMAHVVDALASVQPAELWQQARPHAGAAVAGAGRQHRAGRHAGAVQVPGHLQQFPDAAALAVPPPDARAEHDLLPGRIRRPHRHQGHADGAGGARHLAHRRRHPGLRAHLFRHHGGGGRRLRRLADGALPRLAGAVPDHLVVLRAEAGQGGAGAGRRALADDGPRHRRLHQHRHRQAVLALAPRGAFRAQRDAGVHGHRLRPDAAGDGLRDRQPDPERAAHRRHRRRQPDRCGRRARSAWARWRRPRRWLSGSTASRTG